MNPLPSATATTSSAAPMSRSIFSAFSELHTSTQPRRWAVVGGGISGISCALALQHAGHDVVLFERETTLGGRMMTRTSPFGDFDVGAQYLTAHDERFSQLLHQYAQLCRPWSASALHVLDAHGEIVAITPISSQPHWVAQPSMQTLAQTLAEPLTDAARVHCALRVERIERDHLNPQAWQLQCASADPAGGISVHAGFDAVLLALPAPLAHALLEASHITSTLQPALDRVHMDPCWTLMLAFPQAAQPGLTTLGPQWNAARSTHHRIAWLVRESSKPGRSQIERWTVQANPQWSQEHLHDSPERVQAKLHKAFVEITGIHAPPAWMQVQRWSFAQAPKPLGDSCLWDAQNSLGACGDWCLGSRVELAFLSGLELARTALA